MGTPVGRRRFLRWLSMSGLAGLSGSVLGGCKSDSNQSPIIQVPPGQTVARYPEKAELILLTDRPPQLETPLYFFKQDLTPNEAFFVRWHYSGIPTEVDTAKFRLNLSGHVSRPLSFTIDDLKGSFEPHSVVAVCQCSGNARSFHIPRVAGGQWRNGAMGNAKWTGVRLKDLLEKVGIKSGAIDVAFAGLDEAPLSNMSKFVKSLPAEMCMESEGKDIIVAYQMNDSDLPMLNGFPLRLIVPGFYATYWVKSLSHIAVLSEPFKGFWMEKAYRIPNNPGAVESPDKWDTNTVPINRLSMRSVFVSPQPGQSLPAGKPVVVEGLAMDSGYGITGVTVSADGGATWKEAKLDKQDFGPYSWRRWRYEWMPGAAGKHILQTQATNKRGERQLKEQWNHSGYMRNVIEELEVVVV